MHALTNWKAKRAGPAMTITGTDEKGNAVKVVGVTDIVAGYPNPVAIERDGTQYSLAPLA